MILNCLERPEDRFMTCPLPEFLVWDKELGRNQTRDKWDPKIMLLIMWYE